MDIRNTKELKAFAAERLACARDDKKIITIYAGIVIGLSVVTALLNYVLGLQIDQSGGLSNRGIRSFLSALQTMLPLVHSVLVMCLEMGYVAAMLRIARGQYSSPHTLRMGFDRFWSLLRYTIVENMIYLGICFACIYLSTMIYLMTPLSKSMFNLLMPAMSQTSILDPTVVLSDALAGQVLSAMGPLFLIYGAVYCVVVVPLLYRLRMGMFVLIDHPGLGAIAALRESKKMMRGNCRHLFKLDLSLWWFYAASTASSALCYGDMILPALGVTLPLSADASFFLFYALYWVTQFLIFYYLLNRVQVTYALTYDSIRPVEKKDSGVVLGNIFQM